jgi:hypothetical protein
VRDFVESTGVRIDYRGAPIAHLSLRNARVALTEMTKCQKETESAGGGNSVSMRPASDPFSR